MQRFKRGDLVTCTDLGSASIYNDKPVIETREFAKRVAEIKDNELGFIVHVIDDKHAIVIAKGCIGIALLAELALA